MTNNENEMSISKENKIGRTHSIKCILLYVSKVKKKKHILIKIFQKENKKKKISILDEINCLKIIRKKYYVIEKENIKNRIS